MHAVPIGTCVPGWRVDLLDETEDPSGKAPPTLAVIGADMLTLEVESRRRSASGVVYIRGPGVFVGYLNRPDLTEGAMLRRHALLGNGSGNGNALAENGALSQPPLQQRKSLPASSAAAPTDGAAAAAASAPASASALGPHGSLFRSGDVAHYNADGELVFEGRRDLQIKLRGQRMVRGRFLRIAAEWS